ncbi:UNVERIFIED_CONTAM: hypothetical protein GTU68_027663 [Idotea baltica]|nr:hypothetical protein [Idotea baltica]
MSGWNLALRFGLELAALTALGAASWATTSGAIRVIAVVLVPVAAAVVWGVFNVIGDPSRSGKAPVVVAGWVRLLVELSILGAGVIGFAVTGWRIASLVFLALVVVHYAASQPRLRWLLTQ